MMLVNSGLYIKDTPVKLLLWETRHLMRRSGKTKRDRISNEETRKMIKQNPIFEKITTNRITTDNKE